MDWPANGSPTSHTWPAPKCQLAQQHSIAFAYPPHGPASLDCRPRYHRFPAIVRLCAILAKGPPWRHRAFEQLRGCSKTGRPFPFVCSSRRCSGPELNLPRASTSTGWSWCREVSSSEDLRVSVTRCSLPDHDRRSGVHVYLLIEHQSGSDQLMAFRMLGYVLNIWRRHLDEHPTSQVLPDVLPMVVHSTHTGLRWTAPSQLDGLMELNDSARDVMSRYLPWFEFLLDDVAPLDLAALRARPSMTTAERLEARGRAAGRAEMLAEVMTAKFGPLPSAVHQRVQAVDADELHG
ncbi:Rpn family recombination-promoting nuclease/putative transposase [Nocardia sp. GTS18]|uniref:Rpn family recombination-promoting nuclease/putative transposase n=1 Tax=Nocardia sp. GTS18 TaxID=1778064 RepID=UPI0021062A7F|nr:Rpn family recombination-promoting nuclease/putative transposase [Nocardia sp. GTS18]